MKHWVVMVNGLHYVVQADTAEEADREAVMQWFHASYIGTVSYTHLTLPTNVNV